MRNQAIEAEPSRTKRLLRLGKPLHSEALSSIERRLHLEWNKWDTHVGDEPALSSEPVIISRRDWTLLQRAAEELSREVQAQEANILTDERLQTYIGIPGSLRAVLARIRHDPSGFRSMRFDFHPTATGWLASEVNSDVPGGWREATCLPELFKEWHLEFTVPESPLTAWCNAFCSLVGQGNVALLSAPGFLEDLQVVYTFHRELSKRGVPSFLIQSPGALDWDSGRCRIASRKVDVSAIVRFYQIEWLALLSRTAKWRNLLSSRDPLIVNPTVSVISESKRFPLAFTNQQKTWSAFVAETRDPRLIDSGDWDDWVLKATYSNTGDAVHFCAEAPAAQRRQWIRTAQRTPGRWAAQRRFETIPLESEKGPVFPCVGVYVVSGRAVGGYARLSRTPVIDGAALDAALLIDENEVCQ